MNCITLFSLLQNGFTVYPHPPCNATWLSSCEQDNSLFPTLTFNCLLTVSSGKCKDVSTVGDRDKLMIWISLSSLKNLEPPPHVLFRGKGKGKQSLKPTARAVHLLQGGRVDHHLKVYSCSLHTVKKLQSNTVWFKNLKTTATPKKFNFWFFTPLTG